MMRRLLPVVLLVAAGSLAAAEFTPLDRAGRIDELARMLGGLKITATTRRHAAEMLDAH